MIDKEVIRHFTMECYPSGQLNDHDKADFTQHIYDDVVKFVNQNRIDLPYFMVDNLTTDFVFHREFWLWKRNLRGYIRELDVDVEIAVDAEGVWCLVNPNLQSYAPNVKVIGNDELTDAIWNANPNPALDDAYLCMGMGGSMLKDDMEVWKQKEVEFKDSPDKFEDITQYDENGKAYMVDSNNDTIYMPEEGYDCLDREFPENWTRSTLTNSLPYNYLDYSDLTYQNIYVLLGIKRFVKEL